MTSRQLSMRVRIKVVEHRSQYCFVPASAISSEIFSKTYRLIQRYKRYFFLRWMVGTNGYLYRMFFYVLFLHISKISKYL